MSAPSILQFGYEASLLHSRGPILAKAGGIVDSVQTLSELERCLAVKRYQLLVLCHALSDEDRTKAVELGRFWNPSLLILALQARKSVVCPGAEVFATEIGPRGLQSTVHSLIRMQ